MFLHWREATAVLVVASLGACTKTPPKITSITALTMPSPPAHVVTPSELPEPVGPPAPEPEPPAATSATPRPRNPATAAKPPERPPTTPAVESAPAPVLQTTTNVAAQVDAIKAKVAEADQKLNGLSQKELSVSARAQYDQARGFIRMANEALRIRNYLYAEQLARKAAAVANQLSKS